MAPESFLRRTSAAGFAGLLGTWTASIVALLLLAGVAYEGNRRARVEDPTPYHERVRDAAAKHIPFSVGDWLGRTVEPEPGAVEMLHPNVISQMRYVNVRTGESASLLFVQCSDARDSLGHYPPVCYVAHGMTLVSQEPRDWEVEGELLLGTRYRFRCKGLGENPDVVIDNFMVLPTGTTGRDMESVHRVAKDRRMRGFGSAQVQILTSGNMSDHRREEVFRTLVGRILPLLRCVEIKTETPRD